MRITKILAVVSLALAPSVASAAPWLQGWGQGLTTVVHGVNTIALGQTGGGGIQSTAATTSPAGRFGGGSINGASPNGDNGHH